MPQINVSWTDYTGVDEAFMATKSRRLEDDLGPIKISKIAGRYLVFDPIAVSRLRRYENTSGTLIGTTPQQPTQNVFLGLPLELRPEEAFALQSGKSAVVIDDVAAHQLVFTGARDKVHKRYLELLRESKKVAQNAINARSVSLPSKTPAQQNPARDRNAEASDVDDAGAKSVARAHDNQKLNASELLAVTPVSSIALLPSQHPAATVEDLSSQGAFCRFLQRNGNYMTPGLRFGAQYSVYPGDPLRFHAHFMANEYHWDDPIPILDLVGGGRLATAVKKAFVISGTQICSDTSETDLLKTFSLEWAAM